MKTLIKITKPTTIGQREYLPSSLVELDTEDDLELIRSLFGRGVAVPAGRRVAEYHLNDMKISR